jgi:hypothetical protein
VCPPGSSPAYNLSISLIECQPCPPNYFKRAAGNSACEKCPASSIARGGATACLCESGAYMAPNRAICLACPEPTLTLEAGATSIINCVCPVGLYRVAIQDGRPVCATCPEGTTCDMAGITRETLPLRPGYWRLSPRATRVRKCRPAEACVGTDMARWRDQVHLRGWGSDAAFTASLCAEGYGGPDCKYCQPGWVEGFGGGACGPCGAPATARESAVACGVVALVLLVVAGVAWKANLPGGPGRRLTRRFTVRVRRTRKQTETEGTNFPLNETQVFDLPTAVERHLLPVRHLAPFRPRTRYTRAVPH